jgi:DNA-binding FadR family transcriptional regulator
MGLEARPLQPPHAYEQVAAEIEAQILDGRLKPGEQLPGEIEMAAMFTVNRSTVREAIRRLETEGLVRRASPRKLVVSVPRAGDLAGRSSRALRMLEVTFDELWTVAVETEPLAAALAAGRRDEGDLAALEENQRRMSEPGLSAEAQVALDLEFHSAVAAAGRNRALTLAREPIGLLLYSGLSALLPHRPQATGRQIEAHGRIIAAIRAGDADEARDWMRRHITDFRRGYEQAGLPMDRPIAPLTPKAAPG